MEHYIYYPIKNISSEFPAYKNVFPWMPDNEKFSFSNFYDICLSEKVTVSANLLILHAISEEIKKITDLYDDIFFYAEWPGAKMVLILFNVKTKKKK
jgi:hypothetical protein